MDKLVSKTVQKVLTLYPEEFKGIEETDCTKTLLGFLPVKMRLANV
jgi:hypothetical protein